MFSSVILTSIVRNLVIIHIDPTFYMTLFERFLYSLGLQKLELTRCGKNISQQVCWQLTHMQNNKINKTYPNSNRAPSNLAIINYREGVFDQLEQLLRIGVDVSKMKEVVSLFNWDSEEDWELSKSKGDS